MGPDACQGSGIGNWELLRCVPQRKLIDEHAGYPMVLHGFRDMWGNSPQVFADQHGLVAMRLHAEHGIKLFRRVLDVRSLVHWEPIGDEVHAVEPHDVVEPKHRPMTHLPPQRSPQVLKSLIADAPRMERLEAPALTVGEIVGRGASGSAGYELARKSPTIESSRMDSYGVVQVESGGILRYGD